MYAVGVVNIEYDIRDSGGLIGLYVSVFYSMRFAADMAITLSICAIGVMMQVVDVAN